MSAGLRVLVHNKVKADVEGGIVLDLCAGKKKAFAANNCIVRACSCARVATVKVTGLLCTFYLWIF